MSKNSIMTVVFEVEDKSSELLKTLMENMVQDKSVYGVKVFAATHEDLFQKIEDIEEIMDDWDNTSSDKINLIKDVLLC